MKPNVTEEMISALVDGQLSADEAGLVKEAILADPVKRQFYDQIYKLNKAFELSHEQLQQSQSVERIATQLRISAEQLYGGSAKKTYHPYMNIAAALLIGVSAGVLTTQLVNKSEIEALNEELAIRPAIEAEFGGLYSEPLIDRMMENAGGSSSDRNEIKDFDIDQLNKKGLELLGQQFDLRPDQSAITRALKASKVKFAMDRSELLDEERVKFDKAVNLLETTGLEDLKMVMELLSEAFAAGHAASGFVLAHLLSPNEAELIYRELILRQAGES